MILIEGGNGAWGWVSVEGTEQTKRGYGEILGLPFTACWQSSLIEDCFHVIESL